MRIRSKCVWGSAVMALAAVALSPALPAAAGQDQAAAANRATAAPVVKVLDPYVIGTDDVLSIVFWKDKELSSEVTVRPDGMVTLPLLNDIKAEGRTPEELRDALKTAAETFVEDPIPTVIVKEIKSRRVFITGQVEKPGPYALTSETTVLQLIAMAGGMREFAEGEKITILRKSPSGGTIVLPFNYKDVLKRRNLDQNVQLKPGDTVVVP
jgi:polysaccharide biosynthesis/export protein